MVAIDYRTALAAAVASQDVAELTALAYQLLGKVESDDERRERQADKKRRQRLSRDKEMSGTSPR